MPCSKINVGAQLSEVTFDTPLAGTWCFGNDTKIVQTQKG